MLRMESPLGNLPPIDNPGIPSVPNTPCILPNYTAYVHVGQKKGKLGKKDKFRIYKVDIQVKIF